MEPPDKPDQPRSAPEGHQAPGALNVPPPDAEPESVQAADATADDEPVGPDDPRLDVEAEAFNSGYLGKIVLGTMLSLTIALTILAFWFRATVDTDARARASEAQYTGPRQALLEATRVLDSYGVVDEENGVYRIPIERAMDLIVDEHWAGAQAQPAQPEAEQEPEQEQP